MDSSKIWILIWKWNRCLSQSVTFVAKKVREFMLIIWGYNNLLLLRHRLTYSTLAVMTVTSLQIDIFRVNIQNIIHWGGSCHHSPNTQKYLPTQWVVVSVLWGKWYIIIIRVTGTHQLREAPKNTYRQTSTAIQNDANQEGSTHAHYSYSGQVYDAGDMHKRMTNVGRIREAISGPASVHQYPF